MYTNQSERLAAKTEEQLERGQAAEEAYTIQSERLATETDEQREAI